jgi:hypothetical protein
VTSSEDNQPTTCELSELKSSPRIKLRSIRNRQQSFLRSPSATNNISTSSSFFSRCPSPPPSEFYDSPNNSAKPLPMLPQKKLEFIEQSSFLQGNGLKECFGYRPPVEGLFLDVDDVMSSPSTTNSLSSQGSTITSKKVMEDSSLPILDLLKDDDDIFETKCDAVVEMTMSPSPPGEKETLRLKNVTFIFLSM